MKRNLKENFEEEKSFMGFSTKQNYERLSESRINIPEGPVLAVVVGQSGIGKSTEICAIAADLRAKKWPVNYVDIIKDPDHAFSFPEFQQKSFGTTDEKAIIKIIYENYTEKKIVPTLIIDNIHRCLNSQGKIHEKLLDFLNHICYQRLSMRVIMLASVNTAAYEIEESI